MARAAAAPRRPTRAPSKMNGQRMNASEAPTRRMISISSRRATTASRIVFTMMNSTTTPTSRRTTRPPVRRTLVTEVSRSTSCWTSTTLSTTSGCRLQQVDDRLVVARVDEVDLEARRAAGSGRGSRSGRPGPAPGGAAGSGPAPPPSRRRRPRAPAGSAATSTPSACACTDEGRLRRPGRPSGRRRSPPSARRR